MDIGIPIKEFHPGVTRHGIELVGLKYTADSHKSARHFSVAIYLYIHRCTMAGANPSHEE